MTPSAATMAGADRRPADEFPAITRDPAQREDWRHVQHYGHLDSPRSRGSVTGGGGRICWSRASISRSRRSVTLTSWGGGVGDRNGGRPSKARRRRHAENRSALESSQFSHGPRLPAGAFFCARYTRSLGMSRLDRRQDAPRCPSGGRGCDFCFWTPGSQTVA